MEGDLKGIRRNLHKKIQGKLLRFNICTADKIVETFKRKFLWENLGVETSRSLDLEGLKKAEEELGKLTARDISNFLLYENSGYQSDSEITRCTERQIKKIDAIALYRIKMSKEKMFAYFEETLHRKVYYYNISLSEADKIIKRLEQFEYKLHRTGKLG